MSGHSLFGKLEAKRGSENALEITGNFQAADSLFFFFFFVSVFYIFFIFFVVVDLVCLLCCCSFMTLF